MTFTAHRLPLGCEYNGRAYPNGAIDQYCTCVNGTVACERQIDNTGQEQIKQRMGCIVNGKSNKVF